MAKANYGWHKHGNHPINYGSGRTNARPRKAAGPSTKTEPYVFWSVFRNGKEVKTQPPRYFRGY